ncbi:MAG TPA: hypothetical protein VJ805_04590 [Nitrospiraceae bacterium]|nr:hypothetical protein [Nitrospiraceae bacterium]
MIEVFEKGLLRQAEDGLRIAQLGVQQGCNLSVLPAQLEWKSGQLRAALAQKYGGLHETQVAATGTHGQNRFQRWNDHRFGVASAAVLGMR